MVFRYTINRSLRTALLLPIAIGGLVGALLTVYVQYRTLDSRLQNEITLQARMAARCLESAAESVDERHELQRFVTSLGSELGVSKIVIVADDPPVVVASTELGWLDRPISGLPDAFVAADLRRTLRTGLGHTSLHEAIGELDFTDPIRVNVGTEDEARFVDGAVMVHLETGRLATALKQETARVASIIVGLMLCVAAAVYLVLDYSILRRIQSLSGIVRGHAKGNKEARATVTRLDEIGILARALNEMLDRVADREARLNAVFDTAADAIVVIDARGKIGSFNPAAEKMFGYAFEEVLGRDVSILMTNTHGAAHAAHVAQYGRSFLPELIGDGEESIARRRDGSKFPLELAVTEMRLGEEIFYTGIMRDITQRKETEQDLLDYAAALETANKAAQAATLAKSSFLANMSHEIRTPMTAILGYVDLLQTGDASEEEREEYVNTVHNNAKHLLAVINDILDLSKVEAGKLEIERVAIELPTLLLEVEHLWRPRAEQKSLTLQLRVDSPIPTMVTTDPTRLRQILMNLVGNAIKFTKRGEVAIEVKLLERDERHLIELVVRDSGIGMSQNELSKIFQSFGQADASTTRRFGGTGLGLSISRHLARMLGGDIGVESEMGVGSTFVFTFDAGEVDMNSLVTSLGTMPVGKSASEPATSAAPKTLSGRVLVADDNPTNQLLVKRILERAGITPEIVADGAAAMQTGLEAWDRGEPFDAILMDMLMPEMDGYTATREMRRIGYDGLIIALTANAMAGDRDRCIESGCDDYLSKPINQRALIDMLHAQFERQRSVRETCQT